VVVDCDTLVGRRGNRTGVSGVYSGVRQPVDSADARAFYASSYARLVSTVALVSGNRADAEEVVQEAFLRLLPRWSRVSGYEDPEAWIRTVAFRLLSNRARGARRAVAALSRRPPEEREQGPGPEGLDVRRALRSLPLPQRQVIVLHYFVDLPVEAVATELGIPPGTVKSRLARARTALAPLLAEDVTDHA
jgi:RNA polymerase sigma-70 factor (ECF subfamily)